MTVDRRPQLQYALFALCMDRQRGATKHRIGYIGYIGHIGV